MVRAHAIVGSHTTFIQVSQRKNCIVHQKIVDGNFNSFRAVPISVRYSPTYYAALFGLDELVECLLWVGVDINGSVAFSNNIRSNDVSPLHVTSREGHVNIIKLLVDQGTLFNPKGWGQELTPLIMAVNWYQEGAVQPLLAAGANVHCTTYFDGATTFHRAAGTGNTNVVAVFCIRL